MREISARLLDLVWPRTCFICHRPVDRPGRYICAECVNRLPFINTTGCCRVCGRSVEGLKTDFLCEDCRGRNRPMFDRAGSAVRFEGDARDLLLKYKFNGHLWLSRDLIDWLEAAMRARFDVAAIDLVVPMPTTLFHRLDRGYNPCAFLAKALAKKIDRAYSHNILRRKGHPKRQSELTEEERRENAIDTFVVRQPARVRGRTILVVDDVMTTGSTLSDCARALKEAGAARVWCQTIARSLREL